MSNDIFFNNEPVNVELNGDLGIDWMLSDIINNKFLIIKDESNLPPLLCEDANRLPPSGNITTVENKNVLTNVSTKITGLFN